MSGTAYVLYVNDQVAGPALELLRRVVQPGSLTMPHVTLMYVRGELQDHGTHIFDESVADRLTLTRPGSFDPSPGRADQLSTLFIQCEAPSLEYLHHKPDFPDSFLHISLYDGPVSQAAAEALGILDQLPWNLEVALPDGRLTPTNRRRRPDMGAGNLTKPAADLLSKLTSDTVAPLEIGELAGPTRMSLISALGTYLHDNLPTAAPSARATGSERALRTDRSTFHQEEFWPAVQFVDPERAGLSRSPDVEAHRRGGVFLTPPELAFDITRAALKYVDKSEPIAFGDPSVGSGIFLASLVKLAGADAIATAIGVEADALRGHLTHDRWRSVGLDVVTGDFVDGICGPTDPNMMITERDDRWRLDRRSLILANPPYIRSQKLNFEQASSWRRALTRRRGVKVDERSDLYLYFLLAAHDWMLDDGIAAWLLPTEFMFTNYGAALRSYLTRDVTLLAVHSYDGPSKFSNARVTSCAVILRNAAPPEDHVVQFSAGGIIADPYVKTSVPLGDLLASSKWHFIADDGVPPEDTAGWKIGDLFRVKRGLATGSNEHFLLRSQDADEMAAPANWLLPVVPRSRNLPGPVIEGDPSGDPDLQDLKWLIDVDVDLVEIEKKAPKLAAYLRSIESSVAAGTIVRRRKLFYKQEKNAPARYIFSYMARDQAFGRRFFLNRSRAVILNNYLGLYPTDAVQRWLDDSSDRELQLLNTLRGVQPSALARAGRVYVEGLTKVEPRELAGIRLSEVPQSLVTALQETSQEMP